VITYTVKAVVSQKWCTIDTLLLHTVNRKYRIAYRFVPFPMTLNDIEGHSPVAWLFKQFDEHLRNILHGFN